MLTCPLHWLTGWSCPLCGAQRMIAAFCHGNIYEAFSYNPFLMASLPIIGGWWLWQRQLSPRVTLLIVILYAMWGILRNIIHI